MPAPGGALSLNLHWTSDAYGVVDGGSRRGYATDSVLYAGLGLDTGALGAWSGGRLEAEFQAIASTHPSDYAGDLQTLSNLDAPDRRQLAKIWYAQRIGDAVVRGGIMDLNRYFDVDAAAGLFANSSFGIIPSISANVPASIYPNFGWGLMTALGGNRNYWRLAAFQGDPADRASALHAGLMLVAERGWSNPADGAQLAFGGWYRRAPAGPGSPGSDWGAYANLGHALPRHPDAVAFLQLGASPGRVNVVPWYLGAGVRLRGLAPGISDLGLGLARAWIRGHAAETSLEATARFPLQRGALALQPDLQYILHPSGIHPNALVIGLRLDASFY